MKKWQVTFIASVFFSILAIAGAGWSLRPIIDYSMEGVPDNVNFEYGPLKIFLKFRNRGQTDTSLLLVLTVENAKILVDKIEPWIIYNETQVKFHYAVLGRMETDAREPIYISPVGNPQSFTIIYTIEDASQLSISGIISHLFLEPHGYYPTQVTYNRTDGNTYELVK